MSSPGDVPLWTLKFDVTRDDWIAFERLRAIRVTIWLPVVAVVGAFAGWHADWIEARLPFSAGGWAASIAVGLLIGSGAFGAVQLMQRLLSVLRAQQYPIGAAALDVFEASLQWQLAGTSGRQSWADVRTLLATETHIFLIMAPNQVQSIPLRAFGTLGQMETFACWLRTRLKQSDHE